MNILLLERVFPTYTSGYILNAEESIAMTLFQLEDIKKTTLLTVWNSQ